MNQHELNSVERELRRLRPAKSPDALLHRLQETIKSESARSSTVEPVPAALSMWVAGLWRTRLRWGALFAGAAAILVLFLLVREEPGPGRPTAATRPESQGVVDEVELDKKLIAAFEGVAASPGEPPLRFRCYGWQEDLILRDAAGTLQVERRRPRLEVVPVGFDVY